MKTEIPTAHALTLIFTLEIPKPREALDEILREQETEAAPAAGDSVTKFKLTVNAVSISIKNALVNLLARANGSITVSQSKAEVDCIVPGSAR